MNKLSAMSNVVKVDIRLHPVPVIQAVVALRSAAEDDGTDAFTMRASAHARVGMNRGVSRATGMRSRHMFKGVGLDEWPLSTLRLGPDDLISTFSKVK